MLTLTFTTSPLSSGSEYQIVDTSINTNPNEFDHKSLTVSAFDNTILYQDTNISLNNNTITIPTTGWASHGGTLQITITLAYVPFGGGGESLSKTYLLPTTLNLQA